MKIEYCPVCGWGPFKDPYDSVQELRWSYDICSCCGCEYGNDDNQKHYELWVSEGCSWFSPKEKPEGWSLEGQKEHQARPWPPTAQ